MKIPFITLALLTCVLVNGQIPDTLIDQPVKNFETLWKKFDDHYAFFDQKTFTWDAIHKRYGGQINNNTSNDTLFSICSRMLGELKDGHVTLSKKNKYFNAGRSNNFYTEFPKRDLIRSLIQVTDSNLTKFGFTNLTKIYRSASTNSVLIELSKASNYGYIRINAMEGMSRHKLKSVLKLAVKHFDSSKGIIIDVRFNGGGEDTYSYQIAGSFTDKKRIGHYKCTRKTSGHNDFTKLETWYLKPKGSRQILMPIIILTSNASASATDVFVLAMRQLPYVTIIGDNTFGVFSDMYESKLPNGWEFSLSHQKYFSVDMKCYEGIGITPDIHLLNSTNDINQRKDPLFYKAIEILNEKTVIK